MNLPAYTISDADADLWDVGVNLALRPRPLVLFRAPPPRPRDPREPNPAFRFAPALAAVYGVLCDTGDWMRPAAVVDQLRVTYTAARMAPPWGYVKLEQLVRRRLVERRTNGWSHVEYKAALAAAGG